MLDKLFYFKQGEHVKVQVFNIITEGRIVKRSLHEYCNGTVIKKYELSFRGINDYKSITTFEEDLIEVQNLHLGSTVDE